MIDSIYRKFDIYLDKLSHKPIFPTKDHRWVCLNDNPLISDNDDIAQLFSQINNIPLINIPSSDGLLISYSEIHSSLNHSFS
jgi:hypothetical protein